MSTESPGQWGHYLGARDMGRPSGRQLLQLWASAVSQVCLGHPLGEQVRPWRIALITWPAFWCIFKIPSYMGCGYLLQDCVWKADCALSETGEWGGGWFICGKLCADYNHVEKQCGFSGVHSATSTFQFPSGTRPLPKKKTYLGHENAKSVSFCLCKQSSTLRVNLS